jgi:hypothetical protein
MDWKPVFDAVTGETVWTAVGALATVAGTAGLLYSLIELRNQLRRWHAAGRWTGATPGLNGPLAPREQTRRSGCAQHAGFICRTAVCVTRTSGGVGGEGHEAPPYPD